MKKTLTFKVIVVTDSEAKETAWQKYIKKAIEEMFDMMGDGSADDDDFDLIDFHGVTVIPADKVHTVKYGIKIDGIPQMYEFYEEEKANEMVNKLEKDGIQPELIEVYPIVQLGRCNMMRVKCTRDGTTFNVEPRVYPHPKYPYTKERCEEEGYAYPCLIINCPTCGRGYIKEADGVFRSDRDLIIIEKEVKNNG